VLPKISRAASAGVPPRRPRPGPITIEPNRCTSPRTTSDQSAPGSNSCTASIGSGITDPS
jgi:hypothetical protein